MNTVGGTETIQVSTTIGPHGAAGDVLQARFVVTGSPTTTLRAKVWRKGATEPTAWLLTNTSATPPVLQAPGGLGYLLYVSGSWTGALPALTVDNLSVIAPGP